MINGRTPAIGQAGGVRLLENIGSIPMVVGRPVGYRTKSCPCCEHTRCGELGHEGNESAIGSAVYPDFGRVNGVILCQPFRTVNIVGQVLSAHMPIDPGSPVPSIACTSPIVHIEYGITFIDQDRKSTRLNSSHVKISY